MIQDAFQGALTLVTYAFALVVTVAAIAAAAAIVFWLGQCLLVRVIVLAEKVSARRRQ